MKPHEHAIISLGYAAVISAFAGQGIGSWEIYLAAVIGGEMIDIIDHPLYHLVYNRNESHVVAARKKFRNEGLKATAQYLNQVEDARKFKGLLLHNVYALSFLSLFCILTSFFLPGSTYLFVGLGAFLLHMFTDIWGDFKRLGHIDNWLWVLNESTISKIGRIGKRLVTYILIWMAFTQTGFILVTMRWVLQLKHLSTIGFMYEKNLYRIELLAYLPLGILAIYHLNIVGFWV
ncbi:MAG: hypothetical protein U9Q82_07775, partial [Chloroflexota bacterium]|nr:hypothetical protein [Chloroflexota bacterium]